MKMMIAVDAVGGDFGAPVVLEGVEMALAEDPNLEVLICGPADGGCPAQELALHIAPIAPKISRWIYTPAQAGARKQQVIWRHRGRVSSRERRPGTGGLPQDRLARASRQQRS